MAWKYIVAYFLRFEVIDYKYFVAYFYIHSKYNVAYFYIKNFSFYA